MKRRQKIRTDVPTLWLDERANILRIIWHDKSVWVLGSFDSDKVWRDSCFFWFEIISGSYYCGPLFVSKENEP